VRFGALCSLAALLLVASGGWLAAQEADSSSNEEASAAAALAEKQNRLADKYRYLEELLLKMEQLERGSNPQRAKLLREALEHGKEKHIQSQLAALAKRLSQEQYRLARDGQDQVRADLQALLELLQKEDRARRNESEQARLKEYIKELDRLIRKESSIQGRTEGGADPKGLSKEQGDLAERAGELSKQIRENEEGQPAGEDTPKPEGEPQAPGDKPAGEPGEKPEGEPGEKPEGEPSENPSGEQQPGENPSGEQQPSEGPPQQGESGQPQAGEPQKQQANPARERIEQAQKKMREAQEKLDKAQREGAVKDQEEAQRLLKEAKAELEEILRQLREEEIERTLALLEVRFRRMLKMQETVLDETISVESAQKKGEDPTIPARAAKLSFEEKKIVLEADRALELLQEEGSSSAFPEVLQQTRADMQQVVDRLAEVQVGTITQGIEEDVIKSLKTMIEALQQAQKDQEQREQQEPGEGQPEDPGLVDAIAELKMIRTMEDQVRSRTRRYADALENPEDYIGQATAADLQEAIGNLADRQERCRKITRDLVLGKNE
jgi:hypothetical protein